MVELLVTITLLTVTSGPALMDAVGAKLTPVRVTLSEVPGAALDGLMLLKAGGVVTQ